MAEPGIQELDLRHFPLHGVSLIEASAGTGKTYSIVRIYLRQVMEQAVPVEQICTITFTIAAANELRRRIRDGLKRAYLLASGEALEDDDGLAAMIDDAAQRVAASQDEGLHLVTSRLRLALLGIDAAPIKTIDALCLQWAREFAIDAGISLQDFECTDGREMMRTAVARELIRLSCSDRHEAVVAVQLIGRDGQLGEWVDRVLQHGPDDHDLTDASADKLAAELDQWPQQRLQAWLQTVRGGSWFAAKGKRLLDGCETAEQLRDCFAAAKAGTADLDLDLLRTLLAASDEKAWFKPTALQKPDVPLQEWRSFMRLVELAGALVHGRLYTILVECAQHVQGAMEAAAEVEGFRTFDQVTQLVCNALETNPALAGQIRARYPVALVDEFQDTSRDQSRIFELVYKPHPPNVSSDAALVMIGDPKQAIYGFRGGDVHAYLAAKARIARDRHYRIRRNFRSTPAYLEAVNRLFDPDRQPFVCNEDEAGIQYVPVAAGEGWETRVGTARRAGATLPAIASVSIPVNDKDRVQITAEYIAPVIEHIVAELLDDVTVEDGKSRRPIGPGDIAILTRTNSAADAIYQALARQGYPVTSQTTAGVFASPEARDVLAFLDACAHHSSEAQAKAALCSRLIDMPLAELESLLDDETRWEQQVATFTRYGQSWREHGVLVPLYAAIARRAAAVLPTPGGTRTVTNWLQLAELCQEAEDRHPYPARLVQWLRDSIQQSAASSWQKMDREQLRLETDEAAIRVVTIHRSKGLEYPFVILADPWRSSFSKRPKELAAPDHGPFVYHDARGNPRLDLGSGERSAHALRSFRQQLEEDLRLSYVGLTRARHHTAMLWSDQMPGSCWLNGFQWLVCDESSRSNHGTQPARSGHLARLKQCAQARPELFELREVREPAGARWEPAGADGQDLEARALGRIPPDFWAVTSFSALIRGAEGDDNQLEIVDSGETAALAPTTGTSNPKPALMVSGGVAFGNAFHNILEIALRDAIREDDAGLPLTRRQLARYGITPGEESTARVWEQARCVMTRPLAPGPLRLGELPGEALVPELEFHLSMAHRSTDALAALLRQSDRGANYAATADLLAARRIPLEGLLHGFVDLVFESNGRYYVLDYKTNWLGETVGHYDRAGMDRAMVAHHYDLQYLIYSVALHRWLRQVASGYDYAQHFGGVYYLFVRGMHADGDEGIWFHRPDPDLIHGIDQLLDAEHPPT